MRLLFFLAVWKRPEITEICFMGLNRLKRAGLYPVETLAVISEKSMIPLCKKYGIDYTMYKNEPVGEKKNHGLTEAFKKKWDYLIELGSDDLLKTELLELYRPHLGTRELLGINHFCYINSEDGNCRRMTSDTSFGLGRAISREALQRSAHGVEILALQGLIRPGRTIPEGQTGFYPVVDAHDLERVGYAKIIGKPMYKIWPDQISRSLDNSSNFFLAMNGILEKKIRSDQVIGIDIKGPENIWPFNPELGHDFDIRDAIKGLSDDEQNAIVALIKRNQSKGIERAVVR